MNTYTSSDQENPGSPRTATATSSWSGRAPPRTEGSAGSSRATSLVGRRRWRAEFQVNTLHPDNQCYPAVTARRRRRLRHRLGEQPAGGPSSYGVFARRFNSAGAAQAAEFQVNTYTSALRAAGGRRARGRRLRGRLEQLQPGRLRATTASSRDASTSAGVALAAEFQVNVHTPVYQRRPNVAVDNDGDFVVTWESSIRTATTKACSRAACSATARSGPSSRSNSFTVDRRAYPAVGLRQRRRLRHRLAQRGSTGRQRFRRLRATLLAAAARDPRRRRQRHARAAHRRAAHPAPSVRFQRQHLVANAVGVNCTRCTGPEITSYLNGLGIDPQHRRQHRARRL